MVKRGTIFLLGASLLTRLFSGTEYKKYMEYATGLIVIVMAAVPILSLFGKDTSYQDWFQKSIFDQKTEETKEEIRILGENYENSIWEHYETLICKDVAKQCGTDADQCQITIKDGQIEKIEVHTQKEMSAASIRKLALRYGLDEDCIFLIEDSE